MNFLKVVFHTFWRRAILIVFFALCWCAVEKRLNNFLLSEVLMGQEYSYTRSATDPDGDQVYYLWDWGDGNTSGWLGPYASGQAVTITHTWEKGGSYEIRARAKDINDLRGPVGIFN